MAACSPQASAPGADGTGNVDAAADVAVTDLVQAETILDTELDGTDSLPDIIGDAPDVADAVATALDGSDAVLEAVPDVAADCPAIPQDVTTTGDVPYWIANDIDLSNLGVITTCGACSDVYLQVKPNDLPIGPTCTTACPAPYPCTCGTCPWIETPLMNVPRAKATAIWTGEEVLVFGGATVADAPGTVTTFSAERWNPSKADGFQMLSLPFTVTVDANYGSTVKAFWTGTEALVFMNPDQSTYDPMADHQFTFDPKTNKVQELPLSPVTYPLYVWTGEKLFGSGFDRALSKPSKWVFKLVSWSAGDGWQNISFPSQFLLPGASVGSSCATALDGAVFIFDAQGDRNPAAGLDPSKPLMLRYSPDSNSWEALPQTMLPGLTCEHPGEGNVLFHAFPDGIAFIPAVDTKGQPPVGEIWWKATGTWTAMKTPPLRDAGYGPAALWTGKEFLLSGPDYDDPTTTGKLLPDASGMDGPTWPARYDPYADKFGFTTSVGYPKHYRAYAARVYTGTEFCAIGGMNGEFATTIHADGVRLLLPNP